MRKLFFAVLLCLLLSAKTRADEAAPRYAITDLTAALGKKDNTVSADAINNKGEIAGDAHGDVYILSDGKARIIGKLPGSGSCQVSDINDKGEIVGTCSFPYEEKDRGNLWPPAKYFLWKDGKMLNLGETPIYFPAIKINNRSQVIFSAVAAKAAATLWENGEEKTLGNWLPFDINDDGQIAGAQMFQSKSRKFLDMMRAVVWENGKESRAGRKASAAVLINNHRDHVLIES